jgi:hypothetical protein
MHFVAYIAIAIAMVAVPLGMLVRPKSEKESS